MRFPTNRSRYRSGGDSQQIEIFQCFGSPEALHLIRLGGVCIQYVVNGAISDFGRSILDNRLEHLPAFVLPFLISGYSVHVPDGFDSLGTLEVTS